ncbi:plasmid fertility inhibition factor family protein [Cupriavidus sp. TA19]|uniref:plasmid fertility inhibition factor family protein n=1 Tax=unclassified Cupriavidus TaxID=2640874 RepID=UPI00267AA789
MLSQISASCWRVTLHATRIPVRAVVFKPDIEDLVEWPVIVVCAGKLLSCWERDSYIVGPVGHWPSSKRAGIEEFLNEEGGAINVPRAGIYMQQVQRSWWSLRAKPPAPVVSFINGRHRTRYLIDAGVNSLPIQVHASQAALLREVCA